MLIKCGELPANHRKSHFFDKKFSTISTFSNVENFLLTLICKGVKTEKIDFYTEKKLCKLLVDFGK